MSVPVTSVQTPSAVSLEHSKIGSRQHSAGGLGLAPVQSRAERFSSYEVADFQPAASTDIEWKYTPLAKVAGLTSGVLDGSEYEHLVQSDGGASVAWLGRDDASIGTAGTPEDRASANAWSAFDKALAITLQGEDASVTVTRGTLGTAARAAHTIITAKANTRGVVVIENTGDAQLAENVEIIVEDSAQLTVVTLQEWNDSAVHVASHFATIGRQAKLKHVTVTLGGDVVRVNPVGATRR
jgi:Fe-S cluster assembly protein SufD